MTWEDFKDLMREEFCLNNVIQKLETRFWCHVMVKAGHVVYTDQFHELARMVVAMEPTTIQSAILKVGVLTDEAIKNGFLKNNTEKRGNVGEPSRDGNVRDDNKRSRTGRVFATTTNPVRKEYTSSVGPRMVNPLNARNLIGARGMCFKCGGTDHYKAVFPRAFMLGADEPHLDPNIVMGTFTLNNHHATTLFDSRANYSFVSTTFIPLLDIEPSNLGMDWLPRHKAKIIFHDKVVRIPLLSGEMIRVIGERPEEKVRHLMSAKVRELKLKDIIVVRNFSKVFPNDLSGLPIPRGIHGLDELRLILKLLKKEKLYEKFCNYELLLQEVQFLVHVINDDGIRVDPSKIKAVKNWEAPRTPSKACSFLGIAGYYR
nr:hypothetical protein [Tanacetum cinerariifolium]